MINLNISASQQQLSILLLGAHCDDIEIGCGGTLLSLLEKNSSINITWVVFTSNEKRKLEAYKGARLFTEKAKSITIKIFDFKDGFLPYHGGEIKQVFEGIKKEVNPDLIFTHYRQDLHQDHRLISDLTWNTFRNHLIFEYEIPKWDGDISSPNSFVHLDDTLARKKISIIQDTYNSQKDKVWFTDDLFFSLMRIRGMESNSQSLLAEAFYSRKFVLSLS
jgi:LmbE family N-acetylglucosaminyl deacetylase